MTLPATGFVPTGPTTEATVERVIDGDTIVVDAGGARLYVHYLGIDAPEAVALDRPVQFMGPEASQANAQLVSGQTVILERDVSEADGAARLLRDVWVDRDGTLFLVGLELVKAGFARAVPQPPDAKYQALYADAEAQAKAAGLGLWGAPPSADAGGQRRARRPDPVAPRVHQPGARPDQYRSQPLPRRGRHLRLAVGDVPDDEGHDGLGRQLDHAVRVPARLDDPGQRRPAGRRGPWSSTAGRASGAAAS